MKKIEVLDTTLRDGVQSEGITYSLEDKCALLKIFDSLDFTYIEGGNPSANPKDKEFFLKARFMDLQNTKLVAFGATRYKSTLIGDDLSVKALLLADTQYVSIVGKCWQTHLIKILDVTPEINLTMISDTIKYLTTRGKTVLFDAEHFFDGFKENRDYALKALDTAFEAGANTLVLCDTNGATLPEDIYNITSEVVSAFPNVKIGIHCHNDLGLAVACTMRAVEAGASHIQGTFIGFGERCGNTNLSTVIPNLQLKCNYNIVPDSALREFTSVAKNVAELSNIHLSKSCPYVGVSAFSHKAGMHADGVLKYSPAFEHIPPELVGNERHFLLSEVAGRAVFIKKIKLLFPEIEIDGDSAVGLLEAFKTLEMQGYQFEGADASLYIFIQKNLKKYTPFFELINFNVTSSLPSLKELSAVATIQIKVDGRVAKASASGNGPVNALDCALRKAMSEFYPYIKNIHLSDYKVRVINSEAATGAMVRVLITSTDNRESWTTVGVSTDIIEASWKALCDAVEYQLAKGGSKCQK
ncbi:MAG: citramalate synthase [Clostridia bacterium]